MELAWVKRSLRSHRMRYDAVRRRENIIAQLNSISHHAHIHRYHIALLVPHLSNRAGERETAHVMLQRAADDGVQANLLPRGRLKDHVALQPPHRSREPSSKVSWRTGCCHRAGRWPPGRRVFPTRTVALQAFRLTRRLKEVNVDLRCGSTLRTPDKSRFKPGSFNGIGLLQC